MDSLLSQLRIPSPIQEIFPSWITDSDYRLFIKRDDLIHPHICGNKWRKLECNFQEAIKVNSEFLISFGGAFSNHLVALAASSYYLGMNSVGIIGSYSTTLNNPTIDILKSYGMDLHIVRPPAYRMKSEALEVKEILLKYPGHFCIPQGGSNEYAIPGVMKMANEILNDDHHFNSVFCGIGTGGTVAGLAMGLRDRNTKIYGISPFKNSNVKFNGLEYVEKDCLRKVEIVPSFFQLKFGSHNVELVSFMNSFFEETGIVLDPVYTAKTMFTLKSYTDNQTLKPGTKILFIHTGGLQGIKGFNERYNCKILT